MKPTKNRHYCNDCGRSKILFESEKAAERFIKFNGEEIREESGYSPIRSYYCEACGGWHLTSKKDPPSTTMTQRVIEAYKYQERVKEEIKAANMESRTKYLLEFYDLILKLVPGNDKINKPIISEIERYKDLISGLYGKGSQTRKFVRIAVDLVNKTTCGNSIKWIQDTAREKKEKEVGN